MRFDRLLAGTATALVLMAGASAHTRLDGKMNADIPQIEPARLVITPAGTGGAGSWAESYLNPARPAESGGDVAGGCGSNSKSIFSVVGFSRRKSTWRRPVSRGWLSLDVKSIW